MKRGVEFEDMNKNKRSNKEIIAEKQAEKEKLEKDIAKLKKQENSKRTNKQSWKGEIGDNSQLIDILEEQMIIANNNPNNCEHLLQPYSLMTKI